MNKKHIGISLTAVTVLGLAACGSRGASKEAASGEAKADLKVAMVTDVGGVDDKSFNQSAWEGLQAWGKENGLSKGNGFDYFSSTNESEYVTNFDTAISNNYNLIAGIGFSLTDSVKTAAENNNESNFIIVDNVIEGLDNVASVTFADHEASYLAGIAAAKSTKTNHVGFVGGMEGVVITRFEKGFIAGVKSVNPDIKITVDYAGSFVDAAKGKTIAAAQYGAGADVIFQAAGATGNGVIAEAKALNETKPEAEKVWVIGVDRDQSEEGKYTAKDGKESNFILASTIKEVGKALQLIATQTKDGNFPGGKVTVYGLKDAGVELATTSLSDEAKKAVEEAKEAIISNKVIVPEK